MLDVANQQVVDGHDATDPVRRDHHRTIKKIAAAILLLAIYFIAGKLGLRLAFVNASASAVWAPTGIALAALLILGYRFWPAILIAPSW